MTTRRVATMLAAVGVLMTLVGAGRLAYALAHAQRDERVAGLMAIVPLGLSLVALAAVRTKSIAFVWMTIGALCGFVLLTGFSIGPFFGWEALALLTAGLVHLATIESRRAILGVPVWFILGVFALCPLFLGVELVRFGGWRDLFPGVSQPVTTITNTAPEPGVQHWSTNSSAMQAPVITFGAWMFVALMSLVAAFSTLVRFRRSEGLRSKLARGAGILALLALASGMAVAAVRGLNAPPQMHGMKCEARNGVTTCTRW